MARVTAPNGAVDRTPAELSAAKTSGLVGSSGRAERKGKWQASATTVLGEGKVLSVLELCRCPNEYGSRPSTAPGPAAHARRVADRAARRPQGFRRPLLSWKSIDFGLCRSRSARCLSCSYIQVTVTAAS